MKKIKMNFSNTSSPKEIKEKEGNPKKVNFPGDSLKELSNIFFHQKQIDPKALYFESVFEVTSMIDKLINRSSASIYLEKLEKKLFPFSLQILLDQTIRIGYINFIEHDQSENKYLNTKMSKSYEPVFF